MCQYQPFAVFASSCSLANSRRGHSRCPCSYVIIYCAYCMSICVFTSGQRSGERQTCIAFAQSEYWPEGSLAASVQRKESTTIRIRSEQYRSRCLFIDKKRQGQQGQSRLPDISLEGPGASAAMQRYTNVATVMTRKTRQSDGEAMNGGASNWSLAGICAKHFVAEGVQSASRSIIGSNYLSPRE